MNLAGYKAFLTLGYWFNVRPLPMPKTWIIGLAIFFAVYIAAGIVFNILAKRSAPLLARRFKPVSRFFWAAGLLGYLWLFFSYEEAILLGARFWFLLIAAATIVRAVFTLLDFKKNLPKEAAAQEEKRRFESYLPKKKK
ncbi:hypothetical protein HYT45_00345 [Candidatus Uhrbacteria bacterium]|nr:hypothetical protein [Candidatus Uhrbacteria bacterium]